MVSATDFLPSYIRQFMNFVTMLSPNFGSGWTSRFSAARRRDIRSSPLTSAAWRRVSRDHRPARVIDQLIYRRHPTNLNENDNRPTLTRVERRYLSAHLNTRPLAKAPCHFVYRAAFRWPPTASPHGGAEYRDGAQDGQAECLGLPSGFGMSAAHQREGSAKGLEHLAASFDGLCRDQHTGDDTRLRPAVDPIVDRAPLDDDIASLQMRDIARLELHIDLALHNDGIIERVCPVDARRVAGLQFEDAENGAVVMSRAGLAQALIGAAGVVDREAFARPDDASLGPWPGRTQ